MRDFHTPRNIGVPPGVPRASGTAVPRRPGFGREGQRIMLLANHFNVDQNNLPKSVLRYQVDTASPPRPTRRGEEAPRQAAAATPPRPLPKPLCRCVARVARADNGA